MSKAYTILYLIKSVIYDGAEYILRMRGVPFCLLVGQVIARGK